jgi:hypothetical protein
MTDSENRQLATDTADPTDPATEETGAEETVPEHGASGKKTGDPENGAAGPGKTEGKRTIHWTDAWREAKVIIWNRRWRLAVGLTLMVISRLASLALPASSKFVIDNVIGGKPLPLDRLPPSLRQTAASYTPLDLLYALAAVVAVATLIQATTSFSLSQLLGVTAQRAITDMRRRVVHHRARQPTP